MVRASLLLLEDDLLLGETLVDFMEEEGYKVQLCRNGKEALEATFLNRYDLYIFDINVPMINGIALLGELRDAEDTTPAIFLTSHTEKAKRHAGFESGADDYITKPFDNDELLWRIEAVLRRSSKLEQPCSGRFCIDETHHMVMLDGTALALTHKEYDLLKLLIEHSGKTVTKTMIAQVLWAAGETGSDGALRVYINRIKRLIGAGMIENVRGVGYRLVP